MPEDRSPLRTAPGSAGHGFSLVELLVVIAVLTMLLGLLVPALRGARQQGRDVRASLIVGQIAQAILAYTTDFREILPYAASPGEPERGTILGGASIGQSYFSQSRYYGTLLVPHYFESAAEIQYTTEWGRAQARGPYWAMPRWLTHGAFSDPSYWHEGEPPRDLSLLAPQRIGTCAFPARKVLLLDLHKGLFFARAPSDVGRTLTAMFDGSAGWRRPTEAQLENRMSRPFGGAPVPFMSTPDGLRGIDF